MADNPALPDLLAGRAVGLATPAPAGDPNAQARRALAALATTYLHHGRWGQAIELLEAGPLIGPDDPATTGLLAYAYLQGGQPARCLERIDRFLAFQPSGPLLAAAQLVRARALKALARPAALDAPEPGA